MDAITQAKITQAIEESLPQQVGAALQARLQEADSLERDIQALRTRLTDTQAAHTSTEEQRKRLFTEVGQLQDRLVAFQAREAAFRASELAVLEAKHEAQLQSAVAASVKEVVGMVFRNTEVRRSVTRNVTEGTYYNGNGQSPNGNIIESRTETEVES